MSCPDCNCIDLGDVVEHRMNTNVFGIVIGFSGSLISIRVSPSLETLTFHEFELELVKDDLPPAPARATEQPTMSCMWISQRGVRWRRTAKRREQRDGIG